MPLRCWSEVPVMELCEDICLIAVAPFSYFIFTRWHQNNWVAGVVGREVHSSIDNADIHNKTWPFHSSTPHESPTFFLPDVIIFWFSVIFNQPVCFRAQHMAMTNFSNKSCHSPQPHKWVFIVCWYYSLPVLGISLFCSPLHSSDPIFGSGADWSFFLMSAPHSF